MRKFAFWMLCALLVFCGISAKSVWAEEEEGEDQATCAGASIDETLDNAGKLVAAKKWDDILNQCFAPEVAKTADEGTKKMLGELFGSPEFSRMISVCKGKAQIAADGSKATCTGKDASGADASGAFQKVGDKWYLSM